MSKELVDLTEQEHKFIEALFENGGNLYQAAEEVGYAGKYAYRLRDRLAKAITQAAQEFLAVSSLRAAHKVVETMDAEMPNPVQLQAANSLLDRVGIIKRDPTEGQQVIKANIFILPEKRMQEVLDVAFEAVTDSTLKISA